jgi:hypothetical protein
MDLIDCYGHPVRRWFGLMLTVGDETVAETLGLVAELDVGMENPDERRDHR